MVLLNCNLNHQDTTNLFKDFAPVVVSIIAVIISYLLTRKTLSTQQDINKLTLSTQEAISKQTLNAQKDAEARQEIYKKLNEFYGPLLQLRKKSSLLYAKFSAKYKATDPEFATLTYLLNGHKFQGNEAVLLNEIISIGKSCEELIHKNAGLIDDIDLRLNVIPRATTHFLLIRLAFDGILKDDIVNFKDSTFPADLDSKLENRKKQLEEELRALNQKS